MLLWNDYEGKVVADSFPLKKLLRPEGRSAFFTTCQPDGATDVIRLTESATDQDELLERWRQVSQAAEPHLITIKRFGQTTFDGVPLTYALMESTDASLAEILLERPLTPAETLEVASSVTAALRTLHDLKLTHGHIEAASIHASGETIKLRSDCVRECIVDPEFNPESACQERRQQDVHDLGVLLLQCLTLERTLGPTTRLPAPFSTIIPNAISGAFSLADIEHTLHPPAARTFPQANVAPSPFVPVPAAPAPVAPEAAPPATAAGADAVNNPAHVVVGSPQIELPLRPLSTRFSRQLDLDDDDQPASSRITLPTWAANPLVWAGAVAALFVFLLIGHFTGKTARPAIDRSAPAASSTAPAASAMAASPQIRPAPAARLPIVEKPAEAASAAIAGWHVIAFTYNKESQAFAKVAEIARRHPNLHPEVFSPSGRAPFFAALGGPMSHTQAEAALRLARRDGLPRDTFIRPYGTR